ncbi:hypothetical protein COBT_003869 [Conglomerata obtusa]
MNFTSKPNNTDNTFGKQWYKNNKNKNVFDKKQKKFCLLHDWCSHSSENCYETKKLKERGTEIRKIRSLHEDIRDDSDEKNYCEDSNLNKKNFAS